MSREKKTEKSRTLIHITTRINKRKKKKTHTLDLMLVVLFRQISCNWECLQWCIVLKGKKTTTIDKAHEHKHTHIQVKRCTIEKKNLPHFRVKRFFLTKPNSTKTVVDDGYFLIFEKKSKQKEEKKHLVFTVTCVRRVRVCVCAYVWMDVNCKCSSF